MAHLSPPSLGENKDVHGTLCEFCYAVFKKYVLCDPISKNASS